MHSETTPTESEDRDDVSAWLAGLARGDSQAATRLWNRYFAELVRLAERRLGDLPRRAADEEDVALSALNSFVKRAQAGKFPRLEDQTDIWKLLVTITAPKVGAQRRRHFAARRDHGAVRGESVFENRPNAPEREGIGAVAGRDPTPEWVAEVAEECRVLFEKLDDPLLRDIARWKMEGFSNEEIAEKLNRNVRTVERKVALIRDCWKASE